VRPIRVKARKTAEAESDSVIKAVFIEEVFKPGYMTPKSLRVKP